MNAKELIEKVQSGQNPKDVLTEASLRSQIRDKEKKLSKLKFDIELPSDDHLMDNPGKFDAKMKKILEKLNQIEKAYNEYSKMGFLGF